MASTPTGQSDPSGFRQALEAMAKEMSSAPYIVRASGFWTHLNNLALDQLADSGLDDFKRTLNSNYFQWVPTLRDPQLRSVALKWARRPGTAVLGARLDDPGTRISTRLGTALESRWSRRLYSLYVAMLWDYCSTRVDPGVLEGLAEPDFGQPVVVRHRGRPITQDLCNSLLEFAAIVDALPRELLGGSTVVELGSGYGRLAWLFLDRIPGLRYILVDIPPALAVAQEYLSTVLPERRMFRFRHFDDFTDVADEFDGAEIICLTPNQLQIVPVLSAGLFVNISSLHEMTPAQIQFYFEQVQRHTAGHFYTKQWNRSSNPYDEVVVGRDDYPVPDTWTRVFDRTHPVQRRFFEAMYAVST